MAGKNKKEIRSFEAQNVRFLRSSSLTRILRLLIKKFSVLRTVFLRKVLKNFEKTKREAQHFFLRPG